MTAVVQRALEGWRALDAGLEEVVDEALSEEKSNDPVLEGMVRELDDFDQILRDIHEQAQNFSMSVESCACGIMGLSEAMATNFPRFEDHQLVSACCRQREMANLIGHADAPNSALAKLKRNLQFNVLDPIEQHLENNKKLKENLSSRERRRVAFDDAKKQLEEVARRNLEVTDSRYLMAQSTYDAAKACFVEMDGSLFNWLFVLEEHRGDILDSLLQTLKHLQYDFFASAARAISDALPARMEFRPMVDMQAEILKHEVDLSLRTPEEVLINDAGMCDFAARYHTRKSREAPSSQPASLAVQVDALSLASLLARGFEEGPVRQALRRHNNDTQAALDWLTSGAAEESFRRKQSAMDSVRVPTTTARSFRMPEELRTLRDAESAGVLDQVPLGRRLRHPDVPTPVELE